MVISSQAYREALQRAQIQLVEKLRQRDVLNLEIIKLQQQIKSLAFFCAETEKQEGFLQAVAAEISFTETVHAIVRNAERPLTAMDVRDRLGNYGYDLSVYSNPLAFVHTALKRLARDRRIREVSRGQYGPNRMYEALLKLGR